MSDPPATPGRCASIVQRGSLPDVPLCSVKLADRESLLAVYGALDAIGIEATVVSHVCPLVEAVRAGRARWGDCPWHR
jgi:hypothetical protein